ncbi:MFS general substrate transporter [Xylariaceae sp. FL0016]|nr:MFS general substrate transporter [Xylariaceae sp. FL0016]
MHLCCDLLIGRLGRSNPAPPIVRDQGSVAWRQVAASFFILLTTLGLGNSFGVFQTYFQEELLASSSPSAIGWIGSTQGFLLSVVGIASGALYDRGHLRSLLAAGTALSVAGLLATSFCASSYTGAFLAFGVVTGLGCGLVYVPALAILPAYFESRLALATSVATAGSSVGGILYPLVVRAMIRAVGFGAACQILAAYNGVTLLVATLMIRPPPPPVPAPAAAAPDADHADDADDAQQATTGMVRRRVVCPLRDVPFVTMCFAVMLLMMGSDVPLFFLPAFVADRLRLSTQVGDYFLSGVNGASLVGRLALGWASLFLGTLAVWQSSVLVAALCLLSWFSLRDLPGMIAFVVVYGVSSGGVVSLITPVLTALSGDAAQAGARLGLAEGFQGLGFLIGPPIAGALLASAGGYRAVSLVFGGLYVAVCVVMGVTTWRLRSRRVPEGREGTPSLELGNLPPQDPGAPPRADPGAENEDGPAAGADSSVNNSAQN